MDVCDLKENTKDKSGALSCCKNNIFDNTENNTMYGEKIWIKIWWKKANYEWSYFRNTLS